MYTREVECYISCNMCNTDVRLYKYYIKANTCNLYYAEFIMS